MRHRRDALLLQKSGLTHQGTGGHEQHPLLAAAQQAGQDVPAQHRGTAARPGTAAFHLLFCGVEQDAAAIHMVLHQQALGRQQLPQQAAAHLPQIPGVDAVEFLRLGVGVGKIMQQGGRGCRGHGRAHVVDVPDLIILHTAEGACDYALLARIHGAMVVLYNKESSPLMSIKEAKLAAKYAWMAKDTLAAVVAYRNQVGGYYDLGNSDSVLSISLKAHDFCRKNGLATEMYHGLNAIIDVYINRKDYKRAGYYIQMMRQKADQFITPSQVRRGSELLYYNIGRYYCGIGKVDEGIGYFRKILTADHITFNQKEAAYGGLHTAYQLKGIPDSISKYAQLFVNANDSSYRHSTVESMYNIQSMYDYQHYQQRALKAQTENQLLWLSLALGVVVLFFVAVVVFLYIRKQMKRRKAVLAGINADYNKVLDEYKRSVADLKMIENNFEQYRQKKEQEIQQMNLALNSFHQVGENESWMTEISLLDNELVNHFHAQANGVSCKISDSEWEKLKSLVEKQQPDFIRFISAPSKGLTDREYLVVILVKLHFIPSELSLLLGVGSQQITNIRSKINSKLFGKSGAKTLDANIWRI